MQHTLTRFPGTTTPVLDLNPPFNVVIAYEDFETGKHAKRTYDFLVQNIGADWHFANQMWKFDVLMLPKLREIAVEDAARADIIIISSRGCELPGQVKVWIESWLPIATGPLALVALHPREELMRYNVSHNYLAEVAKRGNMEFFAQPDVWPRWDSSEIAALSDSRLSDKTLSTLAGVVQREVSSPRWTLGD